MRTTARLAKRPCSDRRDRRRAPGFSTQGSQRCRGNKTSSNATGRRASRGIGPQGRLDPWPLRSSAPRRFPAFKSLRSPPTPAVARDDFGSTNEGSGMPLPRMMLATAPSRCSRRAGCHRRPSSLPSPSDLYAERNRPVSCGARAAPSSRAARMLSGTRRFAARGRAREPPVWASAPQVRPKRN